MALRDILYQIDPNTMLLVVFFFIVFAMLMWILRKTGIGQNNAIATVISLAISILATYGFNRMNWDLSGLFLRFGISQEILYIGVPILALIFLVFLSRKKDPETDGRKFSLGRFFIILGGLMVLLGFMPFIFQKSVMFIAGGASLILGIFLRIYKKRKNSGSNSYYKDARKQQRAEQKLAKKQKRFEERERKKEANKRLKNWRRIGNNRAQNKAAKKQQDYQWAQQQRDSANQQRRQQHKEQKQYEKQQRKLQKRQEKEARKKALKDQKWANQQQKAAEKQRAKQLREQQEYEEKQRQKAIQEQQRQAQKQQEKEARMNQRREKTLQNLKSLYNQKYQEATEQQKLAKEGVKGAREKYIKLQKEIQRIVNKMNKF